MAGTAGHSGRKTIAAELLSASIQTSGTEDAKYAYSLFVQKMHGERISKDRLAAAAVVMDRVLGKPQQRIAGSFEGVLPIHLMDVNYRAGLDEGTDSTAPSP